MQLNRLPLILGTTALLACSGGGDSTEVVSSIISPDQGGTLRIEGTETSVSFPAGSVESEIEISLSLGSASELEASPGALEDVLVFAPAMSLSAMATISMELGEDFDFSQRVHIEQFIDGVWLRPETSGLEIGSGGIAYGQVQWLAPTAIVVDTIDDESR